MCRDGRECRGKRFRCVLVRARPSPSADGTLLSCCAQTNRLLRMLLSRPLCNQETQSLHLPSDPFSNLSHDPGDKRKIDHNVPVRTLFALTAVSPPAIGPSTDRGLFTPLARRSAMRFKLKRWGVGLPQNALDSGSRPRPKLVETDVVMVSSNFVSKQENIDG